MASSGRVLTRGLNPRVTACDGIDLSFGISTAEPARLRVLYIDDEKAAVEKSDFSHS